MTITATAWIFLSLFFAWILVVLVISRSIYNCSERRNKKLVIADAIWKDPERRPTMEALKAEIVEAGKNRKITLNEFRVLTGACLTGCRAALENAGRDETPITAKEIYQHVSKEWGAKLLSVLGWANEQRD